MRSMLWVLLVPILGCAIASSQQGTTSRNPTVSGTVVASDTGQPLKKARVGMISSSRDGAPATAISAADGTFTFTDVAPGLYQLGAEHDGYVPLRGRAAVSVTVIAGSDVDGVRIRLDPTAVITGKVVNEDGDAVPYASVEALRRRYGPRGSTLALVRNGNTNDLGEYRIFGLMPGRYVLRVVSQQRWTIPSPGAKDPEADSTYPPLYYPDVTNAEAAVPLALRAGSEARADFQLVRTTGVTVRGRLTGLPKSDEALHVNVMLAAGTQQIGGTAVRPDGTFEIRSVAPGTYILSAWGADPASTGPERRMLAASRKLVITAGDTDEVLLHLEPTFAVELSGQVHVEGATPKLDQLYLVLAQANADDEDLFVPYGARASSASVKADGTFKMQLRGRGRYRALLSARGSGLEDYYTKTVTYGGRDVTDTGLVFTGSAAPLDILISSYGARIEGTVVDDQDKPVRGATVVTVPEKRLRDQTDLYQTARTDQAGHFVIRGQRPGNYTVLALDDVTDAIYMDPEFLKDNEDKGTSLRAEANGHHQLTLKVISVRSPD